jgi:hypothetical protein
LPLRGIVLSLRKLRDVVAGILQCDKLATTGQRDRIIEGRFQPRSDTEAPIRRQLLVPIEAGIFFRSPCLLIAPFLKIGLAASGQTVAPSRFEPGARGLKTGSATVSMLARATRIEPTMPFPRLRGIRDAGSLNDRADADAGVVDVPGNRPIVDALAGKSGHAPLKRRGDPICKPLQLAACGWRVRYSRLQHYLSIEAYCAQPPSFPSKIPRCDNVLWVHNHTRRVFQFRLMRYFLMLDRQRSIVNSHFLVMLPRNRIGRLVSSVLEHASALRKFL